MRAIMVMTSVLLALFGGAALVLWGESILIGREVNAFTIIWGVLPIAVAGFLVFAAARLPASNAAFKAGRLVVIVIAVPFLFFLLLVLLLYPGS